MTTRDNKAGVAGIHGEAKPTAAAVVEEQAEAVHSASRKKDHHLTTARAHVVEGVVVLTTKTAAISVLPAAAMEAADNNTLRVRESTNWSVAQPLVAPSTAATTDHPLVAIMTAMVMAIRLGHLGEAHAVPGAVAEAATGAAERGKKMEQKMMPATTL